MKVADARRLVSALFDSATMLADRANRLQVAIDAAATERREVAEAELDALTLGDTVAQACITAAIVKVGRTP